MSVARELAEALEAHRGNVSDYEARLDVANMLLGKMRAELGGVHPEDPLDLPALWFFLEEATQRVRSVHATMHEVGACLGDAQAFIEGKVSNELAAPKKKAVSR